GRAPHRRGERGRRRRQHLRRARTHRGGMKRLAIAIALVAACKKEEPAHEQQSGPPPMPAAEIKRSEDACKQYVERVCACAEKVPAVAKQCELARALPDAVRLGLEIAASPDSKPD